ncbi:MAG: hypothetical protein U9R14_04395, partial [Patescibacteria group bacterium]|nr:hypothetical protein [Patescibacteria group bacterium]
KYMVMENHEQKVQIVCDYALKTLQAKKLRFRPMKRKNNHVNTKHGYVIARTNLKTGLITIDILTPKKREPKKISSILRTLAHEITHHQKPPFQQRHKGRWINRQHYPNFYRQVNRNILKFKKDKILSEYFTE